VSNPDIAVVNDVFATDIRGHTKVAFPNWLIHGKNWNFEQSSLVNPCYQAAVDFASAPIFARIEGLRIKNYWACGVASYYDPAFAGLGTIEVYDMHLEGSLRAAKVQQNLAIIGGTCTNVHSRYQSGSAFERYVTWSMSDSAYWAGILSGVHDMYDAMNKQFQTNHQPAYWVPDEIKRLIQ